MSLEEERDTAGNVWRAAPFQSAPMHTGSIMGVWTAPDEEVQWHWTHGLDGKSYVSGYTVTRKPAPQGWSLPGETETGSSGAEL